MGVRALSNASGGRRKRRVAGDPAPLRIVAGDDNRCAAHMAGVVRDRFHLSECLPASGKFASGPLPARGAPGVAEAPLQQLTMLITADGKWVLPDTDEFLAALGDPNPDYDAIGFAIRNLGFVKFQVLDRLVTEIELHPRNVELPALLAIEELLAQSATNLFRIKYLDTEWHSEISASSEHTMARLRELCTPVFEPALTERFRVEPQDPATLFATREGRAEGFGPMAMKWRVAFGKFDLSVMGIADSSGLTSRLVIVGFDPGRRRSSIRFFGDEHRWAGSTYRVDGIGRAVEDLPDKEYGAWLSEFYASVATTGQPRLDLVTAEMEYRNEPGRPRRKRIYERLLLPWRTPTDEVLVTSCVKMADERGANLGSPALAAFDRKVPKSS